MKEQIMKLSADMERKIRELEFRENRLLSAEKILRAATVWYALCALIVSVLGLIYPEKGFQKISVLETAALSVLAVSVCTQKYTEKAGRLRSGRMRLERLISEAVRADSEEEMRRLQVEYLESAAAEEGVDSHVRRSVLRMHDLHEGGGTKSLRGYERFLYWFVEIMCIVVKTVILLAPAAAIALAAIGLL